MTESSQSLDPRAEIRNEIGVIIFMLLAMLLVASQTLPAFVTCFEEGAFLETARCSVFLVHWAIAVYENKQPLILLVGPVFFTVYWFIGQKVPRDERRIVYQSIIGLLLLLGFSTAFNFMAVFSLQPLIQKL